MHETSLYASARSADRAARGLGACGLLVALAMSTAPQVASAAQPAQDGVLDDAVRRRAEGLATEAKLLFHQKAYQQAAERFFEAYTLVHEPALIFNAARAYEEAGNHARSAALFRAYLDLPDAPADGKADAKRRLERLDAILKEQAAAEKAAADKAAAEKAAAEAAEKARRAKLTEAGRRAEDERLRADRAAADAAARRAKAEQDAADRAGKRRDLPAPRVRAHTQRPLPWAPIAATAGAAVISGVLGILAVNEADKAHAMEGSLRSQDDADSYLAYASAG
jgi:tetratricopeptide (TPR) repeat protein